MYNGQREGTVPVRTIDVQKSINETNIDKNNDINSAPTSTETRSTLDTELYVIDCNLQNIQYVANFVYKTNNFIQFIFKRLYCFIQ